MEDFIFCGNSDEELTRFKPESCKQDFIIMVPQHAKWAHLIEKCYGDKAKKVTRYAIKKETEYKMCRENGWTNDLVSNYKDYTTYKNLGMGIAVLKDGELVAGALLKNHIMELYEISLLRFKTNGSSEKEKIIEMLDKSVG